MSSRFPEIKILNTLSAKHDFHKQSIMKNVLYKKIMVIFTENRSSTIYVML